jgi:hypothetical protein
LGADHGFTHLTAFPTGGGIEFKKNIHAPRRGSAGDRLFLLLDRQGDAFLI